MATFSSAMAPHLRRVEGEGHIVELKEVQNHASQRMMMRYAYLTPEHLIRLWPMADAWGDYFLPSIETIVLPKAESFVMTQTFVCMVNLSIAPS